MCENAYDSVNCPYQQYLNSSAFSCNTTCYMAIFGSICCPSYYPFISNKGNITCVSSCISGIYILTESINYCNISCALPFGINNNGLQSFETLLCTFCTSPNYV